ncbi:MAG: type III pantothenate kinase [Treponema sp.]|nr:type III pantothenate kinase [Treponema sp.]
MLLAIDIGNTNIVVALFKNDTIDSVWRMASDVRRTADEYTSILASLLRERDIGEDSINRAVLSSVVPDLTGPCIRMAQNLCGIRPLLVSPDLYHKLPVRLPDGASHEIGTDLVCNAVAAWTLTRSANVVVDFGTALSFTITDQTGAIRGVDIAPGLGTAVHSLSSGTAQLPTVPLKAPPSSIGTNTIQSIQAGIVLGYKGLVEYLIGQIKKDLHALTGVEENDVRVVATGGLNSVLGPITNVFTCVDKDLTLKGLKLIADVC